MNDMYLDDKFIKNVYDMMPEEIYNYMKGAGSANVRAVRKLIKDPDTGRVIDQERGKGKKDEDRALVAMETYLRMDGIGPENGQPLSIKNSEYEHVNAYRAKDPVNPKYNGNKKNDMFPTNTFMHAKWNKMKNNNSTDKFQDQVKNIKSAKDINDKSNRAGKDKTEAKNNAEKYIDTSKNNFKTRKQVKDRLQEIATKHVADNVTTAEEAAANVKTMKRFREALGKQKSNQTNGKPDPVKVDARIKEAERGNLKGNEEVMLIAASAGAKSANPNDFLATLRDVPGMPEILPKRYFQSQDTDRTPTAAKNTDASLRVLLANLVRQGDNRAAQKKLIDAYNGEVEKINQAILERNKKYKQDPNTPKIQPNAELKKTIDGTMKKLEQDPDLDIYWS